MSDSVDQDLIEDTRRKVRAGGGVPNATLRTDGYDFWVESWKDQGHNYMPPHIISLKCKTPLEAWVSAKEYLAAR